MEELGRRMTAKEFQEWRVMFMMEELHPRVRSLRHHELLAAVHNGPLTRKGSKKLWSASDIAPADPWAPPSPKPTPLTAKQIRSQVAATNAARRKKH